MNKLNFLLAAIAVSFLASCSSVNIGDDGTYIGPEGGEEMMRLGLLGVSPPVPTPREAATLSNRLPASGPLKVTVEEAVLVSLENNKSLRIERLKPDIKKASESIQRSAFDPSVSAGFSGSRSRTKTKISDSQSYSTGTEIELSASLPCGTSLSAGLSTNRSWSSSPGDSHATGLDVSITHPLLQDAGRRVNTASLRQARVDTEISEYQLRGFAEALVAQIETTCWDYLLARRQIEIYTDSLKLAQQQLSETRERVAVGKLAETELAAAKAQVALRKEDLINARSNLEKYKLNLLRLMSPPGENLWDRELVLKGEPIIPDTDPGDIKEHLSLAMVLRTDLNQARLSYKRGELEIIKTKNGLLPRLDLFISLGKTGYAESFHGSLDSFNDGSYNYSAGISLEYPLGNRAAEARHRQAIIGRRQAFESIENLKQLVELDVRSAFIEVKRAREQVTATAATRQAQEETLRAEREKFRVGKSTSFLVAQAQRDTVAAAVSEIQAIVNYLKSLVDLYKAEGTLLERRGISAPGARPVEEEQ